MHDSAVAVAMLSTTAATLLREHSRASSSSSSSGDDASKEEEGMVAIANDDGLVFADAGAAEGEQVAVVGGDLGAAQFYSSHWPRCYCCCS